MSSSRQACRGTAAQGAGSTGFPGRKPCRETGKESAAWFSCSYRAHLCFLPGSPQLVSIWESLEAGRAEAVLCRDSPRFMPWEHRVNTALLVLGLLAPVCFPVPQEKEIPAWLSLENAGSFANWLCSAGCRELLVRRGSAWLHPSRIHRHHRQLPALCKGSLKPCPLGLSSPTLWGRPSSWQLRMSILQHVSKPLVSTSFSSPSGSRTGGTSTTSSPNFSSPVPAGKWLHWMEGRWQNQILL